MIPILFKKDDTNYSRNGTGFLTDILSCDVTEERNGVYECVFTYPITGQHYSEIAEGDVIKVKPNETSDLQLFRIYGHSKPLNGIVTFNCEHISYTANGIPLAGLSARNTTPQAAINKAIREGAFESGFTAISDISTLNSINIKEPCSLRAALGGQEGSVLDVWGGEFEFDNYIIKLHSHRGNDNGVSIEYGKNLTDIRQERNITETYTHIMPYCIYTEESENDEPGEDVIITLPEKVIALAGAEDIGHQKAFIINLSDMFGDNETMTPAALRIKAQQYINSHESLGVPKVSITASFVALWQTEEYKNIAPLERVSLCDTVTVKFIKLGVSAKAKVIKTVYDAITERYKSIELGEARSSFANTILEQNKAINDLVKVVRKGFSDATEATKRAIAEATQLITGNAGGYVVLHPAEQPQEILIMDTDSLETAVHVWRWNASGLGYSSTGYDGEYGLAMTMNGSISASFITTGTLDGGLLRANSVEANAISAGFKNQITNQITGAIENVEQEFAVADGELKSIIATATSKFDTGANTVDLYGYGTPASNGYAAADHNGEHYLDQSTGNYYASNGAAWTSSATFQLITANLQSQITQNATNISLKVSSGDVVSEINQSSDTISLTAGRLVITSGNFKLNSSGTVTATNVNLSGSIKTERSDGYYTYIHDGIIETFMNDKRVAYMMPVIGGNIVQFAILGSGNYGGVAIGVKYDDSIETYYRCNIQDAQTAEGCRHHFIGTVKFDNRFKSNVDFDNNIGVAWGGNIGLRYATTAVGVDRAGVWLGIGSANTCLTGSGIYLYGHVRITQELRFLDVSANTYYTAMWHDSSNNAINVGNDSDSLYLKGSTIYANNSPISTSSDARKKRNIAGLDDRYLTLIKSINPVSFKYIEELSSSERTHTGFIAQDVLTAMNNAGISTKEFAAFVDLKNDGKEYALRYEEFISLLLLYVKHLESRIEILERTG